MPQQNSFKSPKKRGKIQISQNPGTLTNFGKQRHDVKMSKGFWGIHFVARVAFENSIVKRFWSLEQKHKVTIVATMTPNKLC